MSDLIQNALHAPFESTFLMLLTLAYGIVESVTIYDARLIQAKTKGHSSGVALEADGCSLPSWIGYAHIAGWVLLIAILVMNWAYGILLYAVLYVLKVVPVLERIGAVLMRPFLRSDLDIELESNSVELRHARQELAEAREALEKKILNARLRSSREDQTPTFRAWCQYPANIDSNLTDAMDRYVNEFGLAGSGNPDEPPSVSRAKAILKIIATESLSFDGDEDALHFRMYRESLETRVRTHEIKQEVRGAREPTARGD